MALTLASILKWLEGQGVNRVLTKVGTGLSVGAAIADYLENVGICTMILHWPDLPTGLVQAVSSASIAKAVLTIAAVLTVTSGLIFLLYKGMRNWQQANPRK